MGRAGPGWGARWLMIIIHSLKAQTDSIYSNHSRVSIPRVQLDDDGHWQAGQTEAAGNTQYYTRFHGIESIIILGQSSRDFVNIL